MSDASLAVQPAVGGMQRCTCSVTPGTEVHLGFFKATQVLVTRFVWYVSFM